MRQKTDVNVMVSLWKSAVPTNRSVHLKTLFFWEVITRGRSNLVPDQAGDWVCGLAVLEVRASGS